MVPTYNVWHDSASCFDCNRSMICSTQLLTAFTHTAHVYYELQLQLDSIRANQSAYALCHVPMHLCAILLTQIWPLYWNCATLHPIVTVSWFRNHVFIPFVRSSERWTAIYIFLLHIFILSQQPTITHLRSCNVSCTPPMFFTKPFNKIWETRHKHIRAQ